MEMNKRAAMVAACLFAVTLSISPATVHAASADEAQIKNLFDQFMAACNAKDVNAIMKFYVADETLLVFDVVPPRQYAGANAYRKDWEEFAAIFKGPSKCEISDLSITADGAMAFAHSIQRVTGTDTKDKPVDLTVRVTDVFRKTNGNWLVVHEHVSVPVDLDTGKPDLTSKP
jgi:uncharacterized protein (TIGR02246 family)